MDFENTIKTDDHGMCDGETHYTIEDMYQAFKARMQEEAERDANLCRLPGEYDSNG